jgi:hypothetical protein
MAVERNPNGTVKPGSVLNPTGAKFTWRSEAERQFERLLLKKSKRGAATVLEAILSSSLDEAESGQPWALKLILDRLVPIVEKHEHTVGESAELPALLDRLAGLASAKRANGHDPEALEAGTPRPPRADA